MFCSSACFESAFACSSGVMLTWVTFSLYSKRSLRCSQLYLVKFNILFSIVAAMWPIVNVLRSAICEVGYWLWISLSSFITSSISSGVIWLAFMNSLCRRGDVIVEIFEYGLQTDSWSKMKQFPLLEAPNNFYFPYKHLIGAYHKNLKNSRSKYLYLWSILYKNGKTQQSAANFARNCPWTVITKFPMDSFQQMSMVNSQRDVHEQIQYTLSMGIHDKRGMTKTTKLFAVIRKISTFSKNWTRHNFYFKNRLTRINNFW